jgi:heptose-I-phosphate ethanolaminephosphotransferase
MKKHQHLLYFAICALVVYAFLYGFYLLMSVGIPDKTIYLQLRRYIPCAIAVAVAMTFWHRAQLPLRKLLPHALVAIAWVVVFPLCTWITFHLNTSFIDDPYDVAFGAYLFACTVCLRLLMLHYCNNTIQQKSDAFFFGLVHTLLLVIPIAQIIYFFSYQAPLTEAGAMAVIQTDPKEAREFIMQNYGMAGVVAFILLWLIILYVFYKFNFVEKLHLEVLPKILVASLVIFVATGWYCHHIFEDTGVMNKYLNAKNYFEMSALFNDYHQKNFDNLVVTKPEKTFSKPSTIIMVIGESATRFYMSAYGYKDYDTTPWMRTMSAEPEFILFKHAYTSWGQTVPSLERALTEKNQYNDKEFNQSVTILDLAKKAGYTTYWFSAQGTMGGADTPITIVAKTADHTGWLEDSLANTNAMKYDGDLLSFLKTVDPSRNNFIILHIMGSHDNYINRYPPEFTKWGTPNVYDMGLNYDNSLAYTDKFLEDVYTYGKQNLNLQAMLYFSDHGANPLHKRQPDTSEFVALRIPLFLYLSKEYMSLYPDTAKTLRSHADSYFTNDLVYEMVAGILNIKSAHYDESNSLASPKYKYTRSTLVTRLGKTRIDSDNGERK